MKKNNQLENKKCKLEEKTKKLKINNDLLEEKIINLEKKLKKQENINKEIYKIIKEQEQYIKNNCNNTKLKTESDSEKIVNIIELKKKIDRNLQKQKNY